MSDLRLDDVRLVFTEDRLQRRADVLRSANIEMQQQRASGRVGMIAKKIDAALTKLQKRERWEAPFTMLALDYLVDTYANTLYEHAAEEDVDPPSSSENE